MTDRSDCGVWRLRRGGLSPPPILILGHLDVRLLCPCMQVEKCLSVSGRSEGTGS